MMSLYYVRPIISLVCIRDPFEDAFRNIRHFIEKVYNKKRLHLAPGYKSPDQFEMEAALNTVA